MGSSVEGVIEPSLKPTDELCHRWAVQTLDWENRATSSTFRAMKAAAGILLEPGFPPELDKDVAALAKILTKCKASADNCWYYDICRSHYGQGGSSDQKAARFRITRTTYHTKLSNALSYLKGRLNAIGIEV